ncbi:MAG: aminodeoxychorismate/anthranilate synthase component II [Elusimicrobia bacterium]|nr:aminodeoxychorismate/anthranilate synthase component II [Elusimicrobiota bacterium]
MILLIDNYDSFTYNLYQAVRSLGAECRVVRNDELSVAQIGKLRPSRLILSPGPGRPEEAGVTLAVIRRLSPKIPTLGVCLGHQAMAMAYGGKVVRAKKLMHGKTCLVRHDGRGLFRGLKRRLTVMRYHSLVADKDSLPASLVVTARSEDGLVMGLRHREHPVEGVQFHPESVMTPEGPRMIKNFLEETWKKTRSR